MKARDIAKNLNKMSAYELQSEMIKAYEDKVAKLQKENEILRKDLNNYKVFYYSFKKSHIKALKKKMKKVKK